MFSPADRFSIGISLSKIFLFDSSSTYQFTQSRSGYSGDPTYLSDITPNTSIAVTDAKRKYPYQIGVGLAYFPTNAFLCALDINYFTRVDDYVFGDKKSVVNIAAGAEYYLSRNWALRAGLFTNMSNSESLPVSRTVFSPIPEDTDLYGGTISISRFTRNTSVTLGGSFSYGTGKAQVIAGSNSLQDETIRSWTIFISSSYSY